MLSVQGSNQLSGNLPSVALSNSLLMLNLDYNLFTGGFLTAPLPSTLLFLDISNNYLSGTIPSVTPTDYDIRFEALDAAMGTSLAFYADNNEFSGVFPEKLLPHAEVGLQAKAPSWLQYLHVTTSKSTPELLCRS